ncbi:MAG TPA: 50S ribosomal protein L32 [Anaerolineae bacterium]|nr:50S ribosomal protein L32 [Anaerolineae bacterium]HOV48363.1 50S ribosomal protein L32 [Anaerolineae bacterium]HPD41408.1 50S ribosomal protein L32 [Anaerolineae bacterium]HRU95420.1 50S ribosomal protein L32 [Anaerolineae bacterium]HXK42488.1 50S ribosomal protein L32 [Anaerolineae bacterium]
MPAVPKHKTTSRRRKNRRAHTFAAPTLYHLVPCPECGEMVRPYHVCHNCGTYRRVKVLEVKKD